MAFTNAQKREAAIREVAMRRRVYPRWIDQGKLSPEKAQREIEVMQAIADDYAEPDLFGDDK